MHIFDGDPELLCRYVRACGWLFLLGLCHIRTVLYPSTLTSDSKCTRSFVDCSSQKLRSKVMLIVPHEVKSLAAKFSAHGVFRIYSNGAQTPEAWLKSVDIMISPTKFTVEKDSMSGNVAADRRPPGYQNTWRSLGFNDGLTLNDDD